MTDRTPTPRTDALEAMFARESWLEKHDPLIAAMTLARQLELAALKAAPVEQAPALPVDGVVVPRIPWYRENWHEAMLAFENWLWRDQHRSPTTQDAFIAGAEWQRALLAAAPGEVK